MTDPRVAIVRLRELVSYRHEWGRTDTHEVGELVAALLDSFDGSEVVERVAAAMYDDDCERFPSTSFKPWPKLPEDIQDTWRRRARVSLSAAVGGTKP